MANPTKAAPADAPKAQPSTEVATVDQTNAFLAPAPSYIESGREGLESMSKEDVLIPRLALAQPLSPEVTEGDPKFIDGLKPGMLFNSMTREIYGTEVTFQVVKKDNLRAMEFFPQDGPGGGGVKDPNVPLGDERLAWGENGEKPIATLFRDYIARLLPSGELIALSFKSSGIKVAKALNGLIVLRNRAIYAGRYKMTTALELKPKPHRVYKVENDGWVSEKEFLEGKAMWEAVKDLDTTTTVDRDQSGADDFDYGANAGGRQPGMDDMDDVASRRSEM